MKYCIHAINIFYCMCSVLNALIHIVAGLDVVKDILQVSKSVYLMYIFCFCNYYAYRMLYFMFIYVRISLLMFVVS